MRKLSLTCISALVLMLFGVLAFGPVGKMIREDSAQAAPAAAQEKPSVSIGSYVIRASYEECFTRAKQALESEGYSAGRASEQFYWGAKGMHHAMIVCEPPGGSRYSFHIIVASGAFDARVPDAERDKLATRMAQTNPDGQCGIGKRWRITNDGGFSAVWTRRGDSNVFDGVWAKGGERFTATLTITTEGNRVYVSRRNSTHSSGNCEMTGTLASDGVTVTGTNACSSGRGEVKGIIECY